MNRALTIFFLLLCSVVWSQESQPQGITPGSLLHNLLAGDSVIFYQCHVDEAIQQMTTVSGQTLTGMQKKCTITEKYVLHRIAEGFQVNYYAASLNVFPNRKFSGLKIREKSYWGFKLVNSFRLSEQDLKVFLALERKGREAIEFDYEVNKHTTNQLIIKRKKEFKQLVIDGGYVISKLIKL